MHKILGNKNDTLENINIISKINIIELNEFIFYI